MNSEKNIYEQPGQLPEAELKRLENEVFKHPIFVSGTLLQSENLKDKNFLDIGSGADPELSQIVTRQGGKYI